MRKFILVVVMLCMTALAVVTSLAQDASPTDNDPTINDDANACFAGGVLEGRCNDDLDGDGVITDVETNWAWNCGWYLIRYNNGMYNRDDVPITCQIMLPPEIESEIVVVEPVEFAFRSLCGSFGIIDSVVTDADPVDTDADRLSDKTEIDCYRTDPNNPDTDADGLTDGEEVLDFGTDPLDRDSDGDGTIDGRDAHPLDPTRS
ncbi:MAG: hypothetical protein AAF846_29800 [Chloroflexota bacterium]